MTKVRTRSQTSAMFFLPAIFTCVGAIVFPGAIPEAVAHAGEDHDGEKKQFVKQLPPGKIQEDCLLVKSEKTLGYTFSSDQALRFNLHYHIKSAGKTIYEEGPALTKAQPANNYYSPSATRLMCLMWENKTDANVRLEYSHWLSDYAE